MVIRQILDKMDALYPPELAESWDRCGLQIGNPLAEAGDVLLCLDADEPAIQTAIRENCGLVISHHPLLFDPIARIDETTPQGRLLATLIRAGVSVFSAHTNLDQAREGVSDYLALRLGLNPGAPVVPFAVPGRTPDPRGEGLGRLCQANPPIGLFELETRAIRDLDSPGCFRSFEHDRLVTRVAAVGGAFPEESTAALVSSGAEALVTGEIRYHDMQTLASHGIGVLAVGHDCSERVVLQPLADMLSGLLPEIRWHVYGGRKYHLLR